MARVTLVSVLLLLLSGCMCLSGGMHRGHEVEKKEAGEAASPPAAGQTGEEERQQGLSDAPGDVPEEGEKPHEHGNTGGHLGHMGLDLRNPWTWGVGGAMAVMMVVLML